jgi:integrase
MKNYKFSHLTLLSDRGKLRLRFKKKIAMVYWGINAKYFYTGRNDTPRDRQWVLGKILQIQTDIDAGIFDSSLVKYFGENTPVKTFGDYWGGFIQWKLDTKQIAQTTAKIRFQNTFTNILQPMMDHPVNSELIKKLEQLARGGVAKSTLKNLYQSLNQLGDYGEINGYWKTNPFKPLTLVNLTHKQTKQLTQQTKIAYSKIEARAIIDYFKMTDQDMARLIEFLFLTGARHGEAIALTRENIKPDYILFNCSYNSAYKITNAATKTKTDRVFPIPPGGKLDRLLRVNSHTPGLVFTYRGKQFHSGTLSKLWRSAIAVLIEQGLVKQYLKPYSTRHSFINWQITGGVDIKTIADCVGNSPAAIMKHYLDSTPVQFSEF